MYIRMMRLRLFFLLLTFATTVHAQEGNVELEHLKFSGLGFITTKDALIKSFGPGKEVSTNYECGFFTHDQAGGPYYELVYTDFNYIGSDKEPFFLQRIQFDTNRNLKLYYKDAVLSGETTLVDFIKIFGENVTDNLVKHTGHDTCLLYSKDSDDGIVFTFKKGRLTMFEYWTPC